jgi:hypothetical protein
MTYNDQVMSSNRFKRVVEPQAVEPQATETTEENQSK